MTVEIEPSIWVSFDDGKVEMKMRKGNEKKVISIYLHKLSLSILYFFWAHKRLHLIITYFTSTFHLYLLTSNSYSPTSL